MPTIYNDIGGTYGVNAGGGEYYLRLAVTYSTSETNSKVTVSGTAYIQHKGAADSGSNFEMLWGSPCRIEGNVESSYASWQGTFSSNYVRSSGISSVAAHSAWTNVHSMSFTFTINKSSSQLTRHLIITNNSPGMTGHYGGSDTTADAHATITVPVAKYTISYNANGGTGAPAAQTKTHGVALTLSSVRPTKANYVFSCWNTDSSGTGTNYNAGASYTANGDATLYAVWVQPPGLDDITAYFCDSTGDDTDPCGGYVRIPYSWSNTTGDTMNLITSVTVTATPTDGSAAVSRTYTGEDWDYSGSKVAELSGMDPGKNYSIRLVATNGYGSSAKTYALAASSLYSRPTLTATFARCDANGNPDICGQYVKVSGSYTITLTPSQTGPSNVTCSFNGTSHTLSYDPTDNSVYALLGPYSESQLRPESAYPVSASLSDDFATATVTASMPAETMYQRPAITVDEVKRVDSNGTADALGGYLLVRATYTMTETGTQPQPVSASATFGEDTEAMTIGATTRSVYATLGPYTTAEMRPDLSYPVTISVADRFNTTTLQTALLPSDYFPPRISEIAAYRVDSQGHESDDDMNLGIDVDWAIYSSPTQTAPQVFHVTVVDDDGVTVLSDDPEVTVTSGAPTHIEYINGLFDQDRAYTVTVTIADMFSVDSKSYRVTSAFFTMDVRAGGHGIAFGKPATRDCMDIRFPVHMEEHSYVAEGQCLPVYRYPSKPDPADVPIAPAHIDCEDQTSWLAVVDQTAPSGKRLIGIGSGGSVYHVAPGRIFPYAGTTAPEGYLMCDGQAVSRTTYSALFNVIGTAFGAGDGSTTFNVPDLRTRMPVGALSERAGVNPNLLYTDRSWYSRTSYDAYHLYMTQNMTKGQTYTLQLWDVDVSHSAKNASALGLSAYWGGEMVGLADMNGTGYFTNGHADHISITFTAPNSSHAETNNAWIVLYNSVPNASGNMSMRVGRWKLEAGSTATDWCPAFDSAEEKLTLGATGGYGRITLTQSQSGLPAHGHGFTQPTVNGGATTTGEYTVSGSVTLEDNVVANTGNANLLKSTSGSFSMSTATGARAWASSSVAANQTVRRVINLSAKHSHSQVAHTHSVSGGKVSDHGGANASQAHENMPPYIAVNYIISTGGDYPAIKGDTGTGIQNVTETRSQQDGGENAITFELTDGSSHTVHTNNGSKGSTGDPAGFGQITATVTGTTGTPSVTASLSGPNTAKDIEFEFNNIQGSQGEKGDPGNPSNRFHVGTVAPEPRDDYVLWYNPGNGALSAWNYVAPDDYTDGGWAWRELTFADIGKNGDTYTATADTPSSGSEVYAQ